jgi:hypothetical protein
MARRCKVHRSQGVLTNNPERSWLRFIDTVPRSWSRTSLLWTKERLIVSWAEGTPSLRFTTAQLSMQCEAAWLLVC